ncbi:FTR1 family iron permease [Clostridium lacusfryxellense]|uniref:FTR1 family iron permease n=1 Tax=Clostridium lacusfryxellense TaxID=205328 RepID=UPI001C0C2E43|nr:FTR1 family protein [Clostridium lacusfryxellense]MBU3110516.1 FTR1 family protein [Clostridium lacusfryxellense]
MANFLPGLIMGFREGLEAFLIVVIILQYLKKSDNTTFMKNAFSGALIGILASVGIGGILLFISKSIGKTDELTKLWESSSSIVALILITTFIYWMIKHGRNMVTEVQTQVKTNLSAIGIFSITFFMVVREGTEIAVFVFAGKYLLLSIFLGVVAALIFCILIYFSLVKINLKILFNVTLVYLIIQAGFLLGYGIHEGLSALHSLNIISSSSPLLIKAFDLSKTIFYHKEGIIGLPLYILIGWYSKPEIIQFVAQYFYTFILLFIWHREVRK